MEPDNSSAATAAVSTLVDASFEADTAPSALFEVWPELLNSVRGGGLHRLGAFGHGFQVVFDAAAEGGDRLVDRSASLLLFLHRNTFAFCIAPLRDVFVSCHPAAIGHRPVDDGNRAAVFRLDFVACDGARRHGADQLAAVRSGSREKLPFVMRYSSRLCSVQPGLTTSAARSYISIYRWLHTTRRSLPSNMHKPCDILLMATRMRTLSTRKVRARRPAVTAMVSAPTIAAKKQETIGSGAMLTQAPTGRDEMQQGVSDRKACAANRYGHTPIARSLRVPT